MAYNKSLKVDAKQLACAHSSLILANNFAPVSEALCLRGYMRTTLLLVLSLLIIACDDSNNNDEFLGTWHSPCTETTNEGVYIKTEYVISGFLIQFNGYFFSDDNCSTPDTTLSEVGASDIEYDNYEMIDTQQGYQARWYNSFLLENDAGEPFDTPIEFPIGFYLEGQTLYDVTYNSRTDEYIINFNRFFTKQ